MRTERRDNTPLVYVLKEALPAAVYSTEVSNLKEAIFYKAPLCLLQLNLTKDC